MKADCYNSLEQSVKPKIKITRTNYYSLGGSYLATWVAIALLALVSHGPGALGNGKQFNAMRFTYRPLGSVSSDHVGVQRITVDAH